MINFPDTEIINFGDKQSWGTMNFSIEGVTHYS